MSYVSHMRESASEAFDRLFDEITEVHFADFPDYSNVGDSAIALGQLQYFRHRHIAVRSIQSFATVGTDIYGSRVPVMLNGGGNLGGLYPVLDEHRFEMASRLRSGTTLIQSPQSVHFVSEDAQTRFRQIFAERSGSRIAVRDSSSLSKIQGFAPTAILAPDAVHFLGEIDSRQPISDVVVLARTDDESRHASATTHGENVDWISDYWKPRVLTFLRLKAHRVPRFGHLLNLNPKQWEGVAAARFRRGVDILSTGDVIVTDRLHAMLIGLQMGRQVIAVDNNNAKLTSYANTWFGEACPSLRFAENFREALDLARHA